MKLSMSKLLSISLILSSNLLFAETNLDKKITKFENDRISKNKRIELKNLKIIHKTDVKQAKGWSAYVFNIDATIKGRDGKINPINSNDIVFTNGKVATGTLLDVKTGKDLESSISVKLSQKYYKDENLISGNKDAKHKLVLFSDPLCPFCMDYVPDIIKDVKKFPKEFALYYYHFPLLSIHPASDTIIKATMVAQKKGVDDIVNRVYLADFKNPREKNAEKVLKEFNKLLDTKITLKEIQSKKIIEEYIHDKNMGIQAIVNGTPTIFIDGKIDKTKSKYKQFMK